MGSYGKSFRGLIISPICEKFSGGGVAKNYVTVGKFHKNINFSNLKNLKSFCGKKDAFDCAGIRAQVFRLPVDCSNH